MAISPGRIAGRRPRFWVIVFFLIVILLNIWYDYKHPAGILFDVGVLVVALVRNLNKSNSA
jgi:hypothetical protein